MWILLEIGLLNAVLATILAVLVAVVAKLLRRPALAHALWLLVLLKLLTPPLVGVVLPVEPESEPATRVVEIAAPELVEPPPAPGNRRRAAAVLGALLPHRPTAVATPATDSLPTLAESHSRGPALAWRPVLAGLWLAGSLVWFVRTSWHVGRFQRCLRHACRASPELQDRARTLAARLGVGRCPLLWLVPGAVSPMIWPVGRSPRLLFPASLLDCLDADQRDTLLLHELAHIRRGDRWVRLIELLATGLFWWHPVVWWARREIHEAEEQCCDAWVVWGSAGARRAYALALLETVAFFSRTRSPLPATASGIGQVPHLRRRLTMIVQAQTPRSLSWPGCLAVLGLGFALLPLVPVQAQQPLRPRPPLPNDAPPAESLRINVNQLPYINLTKLGLAGLKSADLQAVQLWLGIDQKPLQRTFLDLDPLANVKRTDNFHSGRPGNNLVALPRGVHTFHGMKFKVGDGVLQLSSTNVPDKPAKIAGIPVNQQVTKLHILHATGYGGGLNKPGESLFVPDNTVVGRYRIYYEDTGVEVIPIIYGKDVRDWWYVEDGDEVNPANVAWQGDNELAISMGARIRLYTTSWLNPKPDKKIVQIEFVSTNESPAAPFCVAITAEAR
jgi:beta-lactamase regulating signal transducer with metallopeptidase domain